MSERIEIHDARPGRHWIDDGLYDKPISEHAKILYAVLCRCANKTGSSKQSIQRLAEMCSVKRTTLKEALKELSAWAMIAIVEGQGRGRDGVNTYRVRPSTAWASEHLLSIGLVEPGRAATGSGGDVHAGVRIADSPGRVATGSFGGPTSVARRPGDGRQTATAGSTAGMTTGNDTPAEAGAHKRLMQRFEALFVEKVGQPPMILAKDAVQLARMWKRYGEAQVGQVIEMWFGTHDEWPAKVGYKLSAIPASWDSMVLMVKKGGTKPLRLADLPHEIKVLVGESMKSEPGTPLLELVEKARREIRRRKEAG